MTSILPIRAAKELRELLPWWVTTIVAMLACTLLSRGGTRPFFGVACLAYIAGSLALGSLSIGHEYTHRTLGALLAQPIDRRRLLAIKVAALIPMLVTLAAIATITVGTDRAFDASRPGVSPSLYWAFILAPPACALFLAPWLTMLGRGPLPGTVFSIAIPGLLVVLGRIAIGPRSALAAGYPWNVFLPALPVLCAAGGVLTWRTFARLQAIEGPHAEIDVASWFARPMAIDPAPTQSRNYVRLLLAKELRLQQMTFVMAALYALLWGALVFTNRVYLNVPGPSPEALTFLYGGFVSVVAGALASAEERHLGVADWHTLLPIAAWKQWAIKAGTAIGVSLVLAFGLPTLLSLLGSEQQDLDVAFNLLYAGLCIAALYVSSLNTSGIRALMASVPAIGCGILIGGIVLQFFHATGRQAFWLIAPGQAPFRFSVNDYASLSYWTSVLSFAPLAIGIAALLLSFGSANHRSADRTFGRVGRQTAWMLIYAIGTTMVVSFINQMLWAGFKR